MNGDNSILTWNALELDFRKRCNELNIMFKKWIEDVQTMDVVTATGDVRVKLDPTREGSIIDQLPSGEGELTIKARTTIQLDGDVLSVLPVTANGSQIDQDMLKIHKENVDMAIKNVASNIKIFTDGVVQALSTLQPLSTK